MTLTEVLLASTLLVVVLTLVGVTMSVVDNISASVTSQYQEYDQAVPAFAPLQNLIRAEVEPAAPVAGQPTPGFAQYVTGGVKYSLNFALVFYANIGTSFNNLTAAGTTAGPAMYVAVLVDQTGQPATSSSTCTQSSPCAFQVRQYLPTVFTSGANVGLSSCPVVPNGTAGPCQYPSTYRLVNNVLDVVNNPNPSKGAINPIFTYSIFDPGLTGSNPISSTTILVTPSEVTNNLLTGLTTYGSTTTRTLTACAATSAAYPTTAIACPLDAVQSVGIDLQVQRPGAGTNGKVDNQTVIYRYQQTGPVSLPSYPYQFTSAVG